MSTIPPAPGETIDAVQAWSEWFKNAAPILAPVIGVVGGWWLGRKERLAKLVQIEKQHKKDAEHETAAMVQAVTQRFQALIDGYEARVKDLTEEVSSLRDEVKALRIALSRGVPAAEPFGQ